MKKIHLILIILILNSCNDKPGSANMMDETDSVRVHDTLENAATIARGKSQSLTDRPTKTFGVLIRFLDSLGYASDTLRVKKSRNYPELLSSEVRFFGNFPFY